MESQISFILNQETISTEINSSITLLDFIKKTKHLTGAKEVCKEGDCGACNVMIGEIGNNKLKYKVVNSCLFPIHYVNKKHVVTIEGLNQNKLSPIQKLFVENSATQCGFCTPGFIISLTNYLINSEKFDYDSAINSIAGNICRCTGYNSIKKSVKSLGDFYNFSNIDNRISGLIKLGYLPTYFSGIKKKLKLLQNDKSIQKTSSSIKNIFISGGTDLYVQKPELVLQSKPKFLSEYVSNKIYLKEDTIFIGGFTSIERFKSSTITNKYLKPVVKKLDLFASQQIRNIATIAGNIVNASPIADITNILISLNADIHLINKDGDKRIVALDNFFKGYKKLNKKESEIIEEISIKVPNKNYKFNFEKVSKRTYMDIASVNSAILLEFKDGLIENIRMSAGGVSPIPLYLKKSSEFLKNKPIEKNSILNSINIAKNEISPISDIRGSREYKSLLLTQLIKAHFIELFPEIFSSEDLL